MVCLSFRKKNCCNRIGLVQVLLTWKYSWIFLLLWSQCWCDKSRNRSRFLQFGFEIDLNSGLPYPQALRGCNQPCIVQDQGLSFVPWWTSLSCPCPTLTLLSSHERSYWGCSKLDPVVPLREFPPIACYQWVHGICWGLLVLFYHRMSCSALSSF